MYFFPHENQVPASKVQQSELGVKAMLKLDHTYEFQK